MTGSAEEFPLRLVRPWDALLRLLLDVRPGRAQVSIDDAIAVARFGRLEMRMPIDNICGYQLTGPYHWWKAIGPRGSLADAGFTFGSSTHGGVCICFREPIRWFRRNVTALTVTVDDIDGLAAALQRRGISGEDRRRRP